MEQETIKQFEEKGLGPLYTELENGNIDSKEFVNRLERFQKRPILIMGRFLERLIEILF